MRRRFAYDTSKSPAAPILPIKIKTTGGRTAALEGIVDTGSDISILPARLARDLRLAVTGEAAVHGVTGSERVRLYRSEVEIDGMTVTIEFAGIGTHALIGRDIINRWTLVLSGPEQMLDLDAGGPEGSSSAGG